MLKKAILYLALSAAAFASAEEVNNPFKVPNANPGPPAVVQPPASTTLDGFQFNGIMKMGGVLRISLFDTKTNRNVWVREGEVGEFGIRFDRYDENNETVFIAQGGLSKKLALNKVKIETLKIVTPRQVAAPAVAGVVANPAVQPPPAPDLEETDEEARARIQRVAEEIRRRRAERRQQLEERSRNSGN